MHNGNEFLAFTEQTRDFLNQKEVIDYYREPLPSDTDARLDEVLERFMAATPAQRDDFQAALDQTHRSLFGIYGHRAATRGLRAEDQVLLLKGLVGAAIANYTIPEKRNVDVSLAVYHYAARELGHNPAELFSRAADYATAGLAPRFVAFGNRANVTLDRYGWKLLKTPEGPAFKFSW